MVLLQVIDNDKAMETYYLKYYMLLSLNFSFQVCIHQYGTFCCLYFCAFAFT